jgi:hypothetical protein
MLCGELAQQPPQLDGRFLMLAVEMNHHHKNQTPLSEARPDDFMRLISTTTFTA